MVDVLDRLEADSSAIEESLRESETRQGMLVLTGSRSGRDYYVWNELKGHYTGPYCKAVVRKVLEEDCPSLTLGPKAERKDSCLYNSNGGYRDTDDVFLRCGTTIDRFEFVAGEVRSLYEPLSKTLRTGIAKFRTDISPRRDEDVERWLALLAGDMLESFLDWLATFRQVTRPTCAVYLEGVSGAGKELLAAGLSQLFMERQFLRYESLTSDFNDGLLRTALVYADEKMPDQGFRRGAPSAIFRTLTGTDQHEVNAKGKDKVIVKICPRVLITANDSKALNLISEGLEDNSVEAVGDRILYMHPSDDLEGAKAFLGEVGGRSTTEAWVDGGALARHVLWLEQERAVTPGPRFLVHGSVDRSRRLIVGYDMDRLLEALVMYLMDYERTKPQAIDGPNGLAVAAPVRQPGIVPGKGNLFVSPSDLAKVWTQLMPREKSLSLTEVGRIIKNAVGKRRQLDADGKRLNGYYVPGKLILEKAESLGIDGLEKMKALLEGLSNE